MTSPSFPLTSASSTTGTPTFPIFLINLARRTDRLASCADLLGAEGLRFVRIDAVDAQMVDPAWLDAQFAPSSPLGFSSGDKACTLSHFRAYQTFLGSAEFASASHAVILEDDIRIANGAGPLLASPGWLPPSTPLLKLERFRTGPVLLGSPQRLRHQNGLSIAPLLSKHLGAAGYIISRQAAKTILSLEPKPSAPIDHLLFNPGRSPIFHVIKPEQLLPALLQQDVRIKSDIAPTGRRLSFMAKVKREVARYLNQGRRIPILMDALAGGGIHVRRIGIDL